MRTLPLLAILTLTVPLLAGGQATPPPAQETPAPREVAREPPPSQAAAPAADTEGSTAAELRALRQRVEKLEDDVAKLSGRVQTGGETGVTYGPVPRARKPLPQYATEADVLAERGVPTRVEWGPKGRTLIYGTERWIFDENGQVKSIEREH